MLMGSAPDSNGDAPVKLIVTSVLTATMTHHIARAHVHAGGRGPAASGAAVVECDDIRPYGCGSKQGDSTHISGEMTG
jgi:hypothetical protein